MKNSLLTLICLTTGFVYAETAKFGFSDQGDYRDVFQPLKPGEATFKTGDKKYKEWMAQQDQSGADFPMEVAPILAGRVAKNVRLPTPSQIDLSKKMPKQMAEFAKVVNDRNANGRMEIEPGVGTPEEQLDKERNSTHVIQTVMSSVSTRPLSEIVLSVERFSEMTENIDPDHYHYNIPGTLAIEALEQDHIAGRNFNAGKHYLLTVIDFRDYRCKVVQVGLREKFKRKPEKQRLKNDSIYLLSNLEVDNPTDKLHATKFFKREPSLVLSQSVFYADHLILAAKTVFLFYPEKDGNTRVVLLNNIAMKDTYFEGKLGEQLRDYIYYGIGDGAAGAIASTVEVVGDSYEAAQAGAGKVIDGVGNLIGKIKGGQKEVTVSKPEDATSQAKEDVKKKNVCSTGLGKGLIKYSMGLFTEFASFIKTTDFKSIRQMK
jgi:hypothetical protein